MEAVRAAVFPGCDTGKRKMGISFRPPIDCNVSRFIVNEKMDEYRLCVMMISWPGEEYWTQNRLLTLRSLADITSKPELDKRVFEAEVR